MRGYKSIRWRRIWRRGAAATQSFGHLVEYANLQRLYWVAVFMVPISVFLLALFWNVAHRPQSSQVEALWAQRLYMLHGCMAVVLTVVGIVARIFRTRAVRPGHAKVLSEMTVLFGLCLAAAVASVDQLVTTNVTPFILGALVIPVLIPVRPMKSVALYGVGYFLYFALMAQAEHLPLVWLSNIVNGLTAVAAGLVISITNWRRTTQTLLLYRRLERRRRLLERKNQRLEQLATRDSLTGLYSRKEFMRLADMELARSRRYAQDLCILVADIDHFKQVNDAFGHPTGDKVLRKVAAQIQHALRVTDIVGRLGGEEFMILLPRASMAEGMFIAEKIRMRVAQDHMVVRTADGNNHDLTLTISLGVVATGPHDEATLGQLYGAADQALYDAKETGRNRVVAFGQAELPPHETGFSTTLPPMSLQR